MALSALTTGIIFKDEKKSYDTFNQQADYILQTDIEQEWFNSARRTFECTKNMMGIKVYLVLKMYGSQIFADNLTQCYDNGAIFADLVCKQNDFELALEPDTNIVCFRYVPKNIFEEKLNEINKKIREIIVEDGEFYIVQTSLKNKIFFRVSLMNPFSSEKEFLQLFQKIRIIYQKNMWN